MNAHTLKILEFEQIIDKLSSYSKLTAAKDIINSKIFYNINEIKLIYDQTEAMIELINFDGRPPIKDFPEIKLLLNKVKPENSYLSIEETKIIGNWLSTADTIKNYFLKSSCPSETLDLIGEYFLSIENNKHIENRIHKTINDKYEINDNASARLKKIRTEISSKTELVNKNLKKILNSPDNKDYFQDKIITIRESRFVIPIKVNHTGKIKGIIHDKSSSGNTIFIEPAQVVPLNNNIKTLLIDEENEIIAILKNLTKSIKEIEDLILKTESAILNIDLISAKSLFAINNNCTRPKFSNEINIKKARHPLLMVKPVPIDIKIKETKQIMIITGPNTGGKTVTLKTVGLLSIMSKAGLFIPAEKNSVLKFFDSVYCDIGDEQSIEQSLSTFSAHLKNLIYILDKADSNSLVLIDELGAGTDPDEGTALGIAIIDDFLKKKTTSIITTHYTALKNYAYTNENIENACVDFNIKTLMPTYNLLIGIPGTSRAIDIAGKLGLPEHIKNKAQKLIKNETYQTEKMFKQIENDIAEITSEKRQIEEYKKNTKELNELYQEKIKNIKEEKNNILSAAKDKIKSLFTQSEQQINEIIKDLKNSTTEVPAKKISEIKRNLKNTLNESLNDLRTNEISIKNNPVKYNNTKIKEGDIVEVTKLNKRGTIIKINNNNKKATISIGSIQTQQPISDLKKIDVVNKKKITRHTPTVKAFYPVLDIRGERYENAIIKIEEFIDNAELAGINRITIIHGKGTGALQKASAEVLKAHPLVKKFNYASVDGGGGYGATEVNLK